MSLHEKYSFAALHKIVIECDQPGNRNNRLRRYQLGLGECNEDFNNFFGVGETSFRGNRTRPRLGRPPHFGLGATGEGGYFVGVGSALIERLTESAGSARIRRFVCEVLAENRGMRALAKRAGATPHWHGDGTVLYQWTVEEITSPLAAWWPVDSTRELRRSLWLWMTMIAQSTRIGVDCYGVMVPGFRDVPSFRDFHYLPRWAQ